MLEGFPEVMFRMGVPLDDMAHTIQVALTPVFLLSGIGALLNVTNTRRARVADLFDAQVVIVADAGKTGPQARARLRVLGRQLHVLDAGRASGALAGVCICLATFLLFLGGLQNTIVATGLFLTFGASVGFTMALLGGLFIEVLLGWRRFGP